MLNCALGPIVVYKMLKMMGPKQLSGGQRVSQKYRKAYKRKLQRQEFLRLRAVIPQIRNNSQAKKVRLVLWIMDLNYSCFNKQETKLNVEITNGHCIWVTIYKMG